VPRNLTVAVDRMSSQTLPVLTMPNFSSGWMSCRLVATLASKMPVTGLRLALMVESSFKSGTRGCWE
jgi:hypothetical protein